MVALAGFDRQCLKLRIKDLRQRERRAFLRRVPFPLIDTMRLMGKDDQVRFQLNADQLGMSAETAFGASVSLPFSHFLF